MQPFSPGPAPIPALPSRRFLEVSESVDRYRSNPDIPIIGAVKDLVTDFVSADTTDLHVAIVRFSAVSAWLVALALTLVAVLGGDRVVLLQAVAAGAAGLAFTTQLLTGKVNGLATMICGIVLVLVTLPAISGPESILAASMAIVAMAIVGSLFVTRYRTAYFSVGAAVMLAVPTSLSEGVVESLTVGIIMTFSFLFGATAFTLVRRQTTRSEVQFRRLFERAPVGLLEQDWGEALAYLDDLAPANAAELRQMLADDPGLLARVVGRVEVVRANDAVLEILKIPRQRYVGRMSITRIDDASRDVWIRQIIGMWLGRPFDVVEYETTDYQGNPGLWVEVRTIAVGAPQPDHVILAVTDVTQTRQANRDLANLVQEKDEFIATVSHELRTPLTAVVGLANEVLSAQDLTTEERSELLELVVTQANEISHLVEDLLVGARAEIGTISIASEAVDLMAETDTVMAALSESVPVESMEDQKRALGDPVRVRQIIRNLTVNAERYGGPSRRVVIGCDGERAILEVRDNGEPLDPQDRDRIFEAYTRAHDRPGVTVSVGLGLSVSRRLARLMGGDLTYDHDGWESIFRLELPAGPEPDQTQAPARRFFSLR